MDIKTIIWFTRRLFALLHCHRATDWPHHTRAHSVHQSIGATAQYSYNQKIYTNFRLRAQV